MFRFNVVERLFGRAVQEHRFDFLTWAIPRLASATALAILGVARV